MFLVAVLMSVVGGVFIVFALSALCYRSVVVHKNFSLCLRLVSRKQTKGSHFKGNLNRHLRIVCLIDVSVDISVVDFVVVLFNFGCSVVLCLW